MKFQVVIPARGRSKRFPGKNLALLGGMPLIVHSINYAKNNGFNDIWVNSDDKGILSIAEKHGVKTLLRPSELASDIASTVEVLKYQVRFFKENNVPCDAIILLQPTNPIRPAGLFKEAVSMFSSSQKNSLATFSEFCKKFGVISGNRFIPSNYKPGQRSQDLDPLYAENGLLYITKTESILSDEIITSDCIPFIVESKHALVDIDFEEDLLFAEAIFNKLLSE